MAKIAHHLPASLVSLGVSLTFAAQALAGPQLAKPPALTSSQVVLADADCYSIGQKVAAENGGTLAKASPDTRGGQPVCVIVVVVPGKDGKHGSRQEIVVPAG